MATIMSERDVVAKGNALNKAVQAREPTANILNLMRDLQKGVKPSEELLRKTGIGKIINRLKAQQGTDPKIPQMASEIVSQWRNQIQRSKSSGAATPTRPNDGQNGSASPAPTPKAEAKPEAKDEKKPTGVPLDKRTWKADKLEKATFNSESGRANSIGLMYDGLVPGSSLSPSKVLDIAREIEEAILTQKEAQGSHTSNFYKEKIRSLYQNLKNPQNPGLRNNILSGDIAPSRFAIMTLEEMKSDVQKKEDEKIQKKNLNDAMVAQEQKSVSGHLECGRCKERKVSFTQAQTRSADEPMTTFCECTVEIQLNFNPQKNPRSHTSTYGIRSRSKSIPALSERSITTVLHSIRAWRNRIILGDQKDYQNIAFARTMYHPSFPYTLSLLVTCDLADFTEHNRLIEENEFVLWYMQKGSSLYLWSTSDQIYLFKT